MSIRAMKWAWLQPLPTTSKFVLLALADAADEVGICWPSIATIAELCTLTPRTVSRALRELNSVGLIQSQSRHRGDGSTTSNRYYLNLVGGDPVSGPPVTEAPQEGRQDRRGPVTEGPPRSTTRTINDPVPPRSAAPEVAEVSGGDLSKLIYPNSFSKAECAESARRLEKFPTILAQQILDELNGRTRRGDIKTTPLAYLSGLINRARAGTFAPEVGRPNSERSAPRMQHRTAVDAHAAKNSREPGPVYSDVSTNPLCRRVEEIQNKVEQRRTAETPPVQTPEVHNASDQPRRPLFPELARVIGG